MRTLADISLFESLGTSFDSSSVWNEDLFIQEDAHGRFVSVDSTKALSDTVKELEERCLDLHPEFARITSLRQGIARTKHSIDVLGNELATLERRLLDALKSWEEDYKKLQDDVFKARQDAGELGESGGPFLERLVAITSKLREFRV